MSASNRTDDEKSGEKRKSDFKLTNLDHNMVLFIVLICSLSAYSSMIILTRLNINPTDPTYFEQAYASEFSYDVNDLSEEPFAFTSEIHETYSTAIFNQDGTEYTANVTHMGYWMNDSVVTDYFLFMWVFLPNPFMEFFSGSRGDLLQRGPTEIEVIDPWGIIGHINTTYTYKYVEFRIVPFNTWATQTSNFYDIISHYNGLDAKIGNAVIDTTCGLAWNIDVFNIETSQGVKLDLTETDFPISRNRFTAMYSMLALFAVGFLIFYLITKKKQYSSERKIEMAGLMGFGFAAFFIDGILDIWFTNYLLLLFITHILFIILFGLFCNKRKYGRVVFVPLLELMMCMVMIFFNGRVDLVLTFSPTTIGGFAAVMATIWKDVPASRKEKFGLKWFSSPAVDKTN